MGIHPTIMRPPYGSLSVFQRKWINKAFGYKIILWDVDTNDWRVLKGETPAERSARVENVILNGNKEEHAAHNGSIVLQHDIHATTIDAMPGTLDKLLAKGFKFVTVSELIAMDKPAPLAAAASGTSAAASGASATATSSPVH